MHPRRPRTAASFATLVALTLAVVAWLVVRRPGSPDAGSDAGTRPADEPPAAVGIAPPLAAPPTRHAARPAQRLELEVVGPDGTPVAGATVQVTAVVERSVGDPASPRAVETGATGRATLDLATFAAMPGARGVSVSARHALGGTWSTDETLELPRDADDRPQDAFELTHRVRLEVARVLEGSVVDRDGRPVAATVWVHDASRDSDVASETLLTRDDGTFEVWMRALVPLHLVAHAPGLAPARAGAPGGRAGRQRLPPIVLGTGEAIEGRATGWTRSGDGPYIVVSACGAWAAEDVERSMHGDVELTSTRDRDFVARTMEGSAADGRFRVAGLGSTTYRVRAGVEDFGCALHPDAADASERIVTAPATDVVLDVGTARLQIQALDGGTPIPNALVTVEGETGRLVLFAGRDAVAGAAVLADRRYHVRVEAAGRTPVERDVVAPTAGATHLERVAMGPRTDAAEVHFLPPWVARPWSLLRIQVVAPDGQNARARLRLTDPDGQDVPLRLARDGTVASTERDGRMPADGWAVLLTPVRPGRHRLQVLDDGWLPTATTIDVPAWKEGEPPRSFRVNLHAR